MRPRKFSVDCNPELPAEGRRETGGRRKRCKKKKREGIFDLGFSIFEFRKTREDRDSLHDTRTAVCHPWRSKIRAPAIPEKFENRESQIENPENPLPPHSIFRHRIAPVTAPALPPLTVAHLEEVRTHYDQAPTVLKWGALHYRRLLAHYYNLLIPAPASVLEIGCGAGHLLERIRARKRVGIDLSAKQIEAARARVRDAVFYVQAGEELQVEGRFDVIILSDTLNLSADVQRLLERLQGVAHPGTRLIVNFQNSLWRPLLSLARVLGFKSPQPENSWLARSDVLNLLRLAGWSTVFRQNRILLPVPLVGIDRVLNRWIAPFFQWFCLTVFIVAAPRRRGATMNTGGERREGAGSSGASSADLPPPSSFLPSPATEADAPSVSVVIPARNEAGNIANAVERMPALGGETEIIFVEGHSRDDTWRVIQEVAAKYPDRRIKTLQQKGRGKGDAVREGFAAASGDILMILDADLTVPPEELTKFYDVVARGDAEFANGVRLVYPMDERAMQFLNLCANKSFGLIFTWLMGQPVKDTLCGTKVLSRAHYEAIAANRDYFGDFDPFGDFDLLFGAAKLNLKIADVPIRYRERTYGTTNIQRWRHGWLLLRMVGFAARKLKFV